MRWILWFAVCGLILSAAQAFAAPVDARLIRTLSVNAPVRQVAATADGQRIYVLTDKGVIQLFGKDGQPQGAFDAGPDVTGITPQGNDRLILQMKDQQQLVLVALTQAVEISIQDSPVLGSPDAPVAIVLFDDFECPYCAQAVPIIKDVVKAYPDRVKLVFKNFPLKMHKHARFAAIAGLAAHRQGEFWPLYDLMFAHYRELNPEKIRQLAQQAGLDMVRYAKDIADPELIRRVNADIKEGASVGVRGTPTLFINGRRVQQRSVAAMSKMIDLELERLGLKQK